MILKLNKKQAYVILVISIIFEQIGTGFLEACDAFTKLAPTIGLIIAYILSYWFFAQLLQHINLSVSYSTWTAAGTVSAALIGLFAFGQHISLVGWLGIVIMWRMCTAHPKRTGTRITLCQWRSIRRRTDGNYNVDGVCFPGGCSGH